MNRLDLAAVREADDAARQAFMAACAPVLALDADLWARITTTADDMVVATTHRQMSAARAESEPA